MLWNLLKSRYVMVTMRLPWAYAYPKTLMEVLRDSGASR